MPYETITTTRTKLFERVWTAPMRDVAPEYGFTDVGLKKVCKRLGIPTPPQGHWITAAERRGSRPPLPPAPPGTDDESEFRKWLPDPPTANPQQRSPPELEARLAKEGEPASRIVVPDHLENPHLLIRSLRDELKAGGAMDDGFIHLRSDRIVDAHASKAQSRRALRILNALFKALEARGCPVTVAGRPPTHQGWPPWDENDPKATRARVDGEWVALRLTERWRFAVPPGKHPPPHLKGEALQNWKAFYLVKQRTPAGRLRLQACAGWRQKEWVEGPGGPLEERLNEVVAGLFELAYDRKERRELARLEQARKEKEEQERRLQEQLAEQERKRVRRLMSLGSRWSDLREVRSLLSAVKREMAKHRNAPIHADIRERIAWAEATIDEMDPVAEFLEGEWN